MSLQIDELALLLPLVVGVSILLWPGASSTAAGGGSGNRRPRLGDRRPVPLVARALRRAAALLPSRRPHRGQEAGELHVLDALAAGLEAGLPLPRALALAVAGPDGHGVESQSLPDRSRAAWAALARAADEGQPLAPAWGRLARHTGSPTAASVARAWRVADITGAPLAGAIRMSAHASRERQRLRRSLEVATAGARATATVLTLLPVAGIGLAALVGIGPAQLYGSPLAIASLGGGVLLVVAGHLIVQRLVRHVTGGLA